MSFNRQKQIHRLDLLNYFSAVYSKKMYRNYISGTHSFSEWTGMTGYIDGPVTFVALELENGQVFTGWTKFNPNDRKYDERGGVFRAIERALDKYVDYVLDRNHQRFLADQDMLDNGETLEQLERETENALSTIHDAGQGSQDAEGSGR